MSSIVKVQPKVAVIEIHWQAFSVLLIQHRPQNWYETCVKILVCSRNWQVTADDLLLTNQILALPDFETHVALEYDSSSEKDRAGFMLQCMGVTDRLFTPDWWDFKIPDSEIDIKVNIGGLLGAAGMTHWEAILPFYTAMAQNSPASTGYHLPDYEVNPVEALPYLLQSVLYF